MWFSFVGGEEWRNDWFHMYLMVSAVWSKLCWGAGKCFYTVGIGSALIRVCWFFVSSTLFCSYSRTYKGSTRIYIIEALSRVDDEGQGRWQIKFGDIAIKACKGGLLTRVQEEMAAVVENLSILGGNFTSLQFVTGKAFLGIVLLFLFH